MPIELLTSFESLLAPRKEALAHSIADLYEAFRGCKLRPIVSGCDHCVFPEDNALIHSQPLRKLSGMDLAKYAENALTTWGDENDFRHFLPRIFELMVGVGESGIPVCPEIITGKLRYGNWERWPPRQREPILQFFDCFWRRVLAEYPCALGEANEVLCTIANAAADLEPYLAAWRREESPPAACHLASFIIEAVPLWTRKKKLGDAFWDPNTRQVEQVVDFLRSLELHSHVEKRFWDFEKNQPEIAAALSTAAGYLEILKSASG